MPNAYIQQQEFVASYLVRNMVNPSRTQERGSISLGPPRNDKIRGQLSKIHRVDTGVSQLCLK